MELVQPVGQPPTCASIYILMVTLIILMTVIIVIIIMIIIENCDKQLPKKFIRELWPISREVRQQQRQLQRKQRQTLGRGSSSLLSPGISMIRWQVIISVTWNFDNFLFLGFEVIVITWFIGISNPGKDEAWYSFLISDSCALERPGGGNNNGQIKCHTYHDERIKNTLSTEKSLSLHHCT